MTAGVEVIHDEGRVQLSHDFTYFNLFTKIVLSGTGGWSQFGTTGSYQDVTVSGIGMADVPMPALSSAAGTYCNRIASTGSSVTWRIYRVSSGNHPVTLYVFTVTAPVVSGYNGGLEIYGPDGVLRFSDSGKWCSILGVFENDVYTGKSRSGRSCAHVPQKQITSQYNLFTVGGLGSCVQPGGTAGYQVYQQSGWSRSVIVCNGDALSRTQVAMQTSTVPVQCSPSPVGPISTSSEAPGFRSMILDVTGY